MKTYTGRLACDGQGNLLADESKTVGYKTVTVYDEAGEPLVDDETGEALTISVPIRKIGKNHGKPVAFADGAFAFVESGEPSHNERHHQQFVEMDGTRDETQVAKAAEDQGLPFDAYAALFPPNADADHNQHHFGVQPDDPHYAEDAGNNTRMKFDPDKMAATVTGHTEAYKNE